MYSQSKCQFVLLGSFCSITLLPEHTRRSLLCFFIGGQHSSSIWDLPKREMGCRTHSASRSILQLPRRDQAGRQRWNGTVVSGSD